MGARPQELPAGRITVTLSEAARLLSCRIHAVRHLVWRGDLPYIKLGKRFVIRVSALQEFAERAETKV
jgi:excisionase family DNA binding protein